MPALRDPDRRIPLLKEVEKWSSTHADNILEVAARRQIEKAWTQMTDALHQMARTQFLRTTSTVPAEIMDATARRREALRHRQFCREALAETNDSDSLLALAWTTWIAVHNPKLATKNVRRLVQAENSITTGPAMLRTTRSMGETRSLTDVAPSTEAGREEKRTKKTKAWRPWAEGGVVRTEGEEI